MNMFLIEEDNGRQTLVNADNVTFVRDYKGHRVIYFTGGKYPYIRTKLTVTEIQKLMM